MLYIVLYWLFFFQINLPYFLKYWKVWLAFNGWIFQACFFNRRNSFLSFGGPQLYNLEALPFTYDQYVVIEFADKLYNSATVCFWIFILINNFSKLPAPGSNHWSLDYKASALPLNHGGPIFTSVYHRHIEFIFIILNFLNKKWHCLPGCPAKW